MGRSGIKARITAHIVDAPLPPICGDADPNEVAIAEFAQRSADERLGADMANAWPARESGEAAVG